MALRGAVGPAAVEGPPRGRGAGRLLLAAAALILIALFPYLPGLVGGAVLYVVAAPFHRRLAPRLGARSAAFLLSVLLLLLLLVPGSWLLSTVIDQAPDALRAVQRSAALERLSGTRLGGVDVREHVSGMAGAAFSWLSAQAMSALGSMVHAALNVVIALFGVYYLLTAAGGLWERMRRVLAVPEPVAAALRVRFVEVTEAMLLGTLLTALLQGLLIGLGLAAVGIRGAVLWGLVTACASVLPVFGSAFVWLPAAGVLALDQRYGAAAFILVIGGGLASNLDNVVRLVVYRRVSGIHPMLTLVGAVAGVEVFGIAGVLIGPLALSYFFELLRVYEEFAGAPAGEPLAPAPPRAGSLPTHAARA